MPFTPGAVGPHMNWSDHHKGSVFLHRVNALSARASTAVTVTVVLAAFLVVGAALGFPERWIKYLEIVGTTLTVVMVFVIQHTQARQQTAVQLKLDEILRALPRASNQMIHIEQAPEAELEALEERHLGLREDAVDDTDDPPFS